LFALLLHLLLASIGEYVPAVQREIRVGESEGGEVRGGRGGKGGWDLKKTTAKKDRASSISIFPL
jgi:hypothetical protein